jgi:uncharacterized protein (DUF1697 family)
MQTTQHSTRTYRFGTLMYVPSHVALLRGINVGGHNRVAMADLRGVFSSLGHADVATYIQSGNVVFTPARDADGTALARQLERAIATSLEVAPSVVVRSRDELAKVVRDNPYPEEANPKSLHAIFLTADLPSDLADKVAAAQRQAADKGCRDTAALVDRTVFLRTPDGLGRSKLAGLLTARTSPAFADVTVRNWATVTKLLAMCDG